VILINNESIIYTVIAIRFQKFVIALFDVSSGQPKLVRLNELLIVPSHEI
jgi:hypothetical protein